jgi:tRNA1(Val) A37 N6-methylase TrmN6
MARERLAGDISEDAALGGRLRLLQPRKGHRFGHDAVLLSAATAAKAGDHVVELGAGVGLAGLALAQRVPEARMTLLDIDASLVGLAAENVARNGLAGRVSAVALDVTAPPRQFAAAGLPPGTAAVVMMNPPFNDSARTRPSPDRNRAGAHLAGPGLLAEWVRTASRLLAPGGRLTLIWRAEGLADVLACLERGFGGVCILPVHPNPDAAAIRILVSALKGSRAPLALLSGLALNDLAGKPTPAAEAILRHGATLPMGAPSTPALAGPA